LSDTRKAHQWLHWTPSLRRRAPRRERRSIKDAAALAEELRVLLVRNHSSPRPTDDQVWEIVRMRSYDFKVFDPRYAEVILEQVACPELDMVA
jgi:hypothetical protein